MASAPATPPASSRASRARGDADEAARGLSRMNIIYFDCVSGASGDMILGSLVALGAPLPEIDRRLRALPLDGFTLGEKRVERHGFVAVRTTEIEAELTTPTGAALLRALCETIGEPVGIRPRKTGVATGTMDIKEFPNVLRAILGEPLVGEGAGSVEVLETTIDDMNP